MEKPATPIVHDNVARVDAACIQYRAAEKNDAYLYDQRAADQLRRAGPGQRAGRHPHSRLVELDVYLGAGAPVA
jgi:hypothetical protein